MEYNIDHIESKSRFETVIEGQTAFVQYVINNDVFDITGTFVPKELEGRGIASKLVGFAYSYAKDNHYSLKGSCSYADVWLRRHSS